MPNVHNRRDSVAEEMTRALDPQTVISALEETMDASHSANDEEQEPGPMLRKFGSE